MQRHAGKMPQRRGQLKLSLKQIDEVMHEVTKWKYLQSSSVNLAGPGAKKTSKGWDYHKPAIWISATENFDLSVPIPDFISFQVHIWFEPYFR